jgi:hypothetical protein
VVDDACELDQESIPRGLDDAFPMLSDLEIKKIAPMSPERRERAFLIGAHQATVAGNIGRENRLKLTGGDQ